jgi:hypothetical protein
MKILGWFKKKKKKTAFATLLVSIGTAVVINQACSQEIHRLAQETVQEQRIQKNNDLRSKASKRKKKVRIITTTDYNNTRDKEETVRHPYEEDLAEHWRKSESTSWEITKALDEARQAVEKEDLKKAKDSILKAYVSFEPALREASIVRADDEAKRKELERLYRSELDSLVEISEDLIIIYEIYLEELESNPIDMIKDLNDNGELHGTYTDQQIIDNEELLIESLVDSFESSIQFLRSDIEEATKLIDDWAN